MIHTLKYRPWFKMRRLLLIYFTLNIGKCNAAPLPDKMKATNLMNNSVNL